MKKIFLSLLILIATLFADPIITAHSAINSGNYRIAEIIVDSCFDASPKSSEVLFLKALLATDGLEARKLYKKAYHGTGINDSMRAVIYKKLEDYHVASENQDSLEFVRKEINKYKELFTKESKPKSTKLTSVDKLFYTIQTGAFGLKKNAENMKSRLTAYCKNVEIIEQVVGERTLYKVRVGRFATDKSALSYAEKNLRAKGIKFRIVKL